MSGSTEQNACEVNCKKQKLKKYISCRTQYCSISSIYCIISYCVNIRVRKASALNRDKWIADSIVSILVWQMS